MPDGGADKMMARYELIADVVEPEFFLERWSMPIYAPYYRSSNLLRLFSGAV